MALNRLATIWSDLPACSVVVFRHLQKTGGSSVVKLFEDLQHDLQWSVAGYWTPCWRNRAQYVAQGRLRWLRGLRRLLTLANGSAVAARQLLLDTPPWSPRMLLHLHHPDSTECGGLPALQRELDRLRPHAATLTCRIVVTMLVRSPWSFYVSWWYYAGSRRCGECSFEEYLALNPNAQAHMAVGRKARDYSDALRARHAARDGQLRSELAQTLRGVDVLGPTGRLDELVFLLCERAGLRTCPRPGHTNARNARAAAGLLRAASRHGANASAFAPDATRRAHVSAVERAGWLDDYFHSEAHRSLDAAVGTGADDVSAARRRRLEEWRTLPPDQSSGCLTYGETSSAAATEATGKAAAAAARAAMRTTTSAAAEPPSQLQRAMRLGAGGSAESTGLWQLPWHGDAAIASTERAAEAAQRCQSMRRAAKAAGSGLVDRVPPALRPVLLEESPDARPTLAAMCSTKVRLAGVRRGCHLDQ